MEPDSPQILYLNTAAGDRIQAMTLAGIRRYAGALGWEVRSVPWQESRPEDIAPLLGAHRPVAGCVVECSDGNSHLPPRLFGRVPVVYLHAAPTLYGGRIVRVSADNEAVARAAFRELSARRPEAYAVVGFRNNLFWSLARERAFAALTSENGSACRVFDIRGAKRRPELLAEWIAALPPRTAVFAVNDDTAAEVVVAARRARRAIPRELTLLGVDNDAAICETSAPPISSIQIDHERAGFLAARLLADDCDGHVVATIGPLMSVWRESTRGTGRRDPHILAAVERIRREACNGLSARDVIAAAPGSRSLFNLRFREAMGRSVLDEIRHVRLEKVETLLAQTDMSLGAIAGLCGWGSSLSLQRFFLAQTGMTMREWRRRNRG